MLENALMKITKREFWIASVASLAGFMLCYFLFGERATPRAPSQMKLVVTSPNTSAVPKQTWAGAPFRLTNASPSRPLAGSYVIKPRPELLGQPARRNVDLTSSRYKAEVDLSDLY